MDLRRRAWPGRNTGIVVISSGFNGDDTGGPVTHRPGGPEPETCLGAEPPDCAPEPKPEIYLVRPRSPNDGKLPEPEENLRRHTVQLVSPGTRRKAQPSDGEPAAGRFRSRNRFVHFANHQSAFGLASQPVLLELVRVSRYPRR